MIFSARPGIVVIRLAYMRVTADLGLEDMDGSGVGEERGGNSQNYSFKLFSVLNCVSNTNGVVDNTSSLEWR